MILRHQISATYSLQLAVFIPIILDRLPQINCIYNTPEQHWNQIPKPVRELSKTLFKKKVKQYFFKDLINLGYDVEISNLFKFQP